jgi:p-aminobenzoyl-glutamate transporter AbgT
MNTTKPASRFNFLDIIEWSGNKLPDPAMLFVWASAIVITVSAGGGLEYVPAAGVAG